MLEINDTNFDKIIKELGDNTLIVDFGASWCPPCRALAPTYKKWSESHSEKASFAKSDIDDCPSLATALKISAVPTIVIFKNGKESKRFIGAMSERELLEHL